MLIIKESKARGRQSSGWKSNHMKETEKKSFNILIKNKRRWNAGQGQGSSAQSVLISCGDFGHRSLKTENAQFCQSITEGPGSGKAEVWRPSGLKHRTGILRNPSSPQALLPQPVQEDLGRASQSLPVPGSMIQGSQLLISQKSGVGQVSRRG